MFFLSNRNIDPPARAKKYSELLAKEENCNTHLVVYMVDFDQLKAITLVVSYDMNNFFGLKPSRSTFP